MAGETSIPRKKVTRRTSQRAVEYLLGYPAASNEEVVKATGCGLRSVSRARAMLVATGQLSRSWYDRQQRPNGPNESSPEGGADATSAPPLSDLPVEGPRDPAALEKALRTDHGPPLTNDQMRARYSAIARYAQKTGEFNLEMAAMQAFARLEAQTGARNRLGPPPPFTREDRRNRVIPILQAAGPSIVAESAVLAFENSELTDFLNELGERIARKAEDERIAAENRPSEGSPGAQRDQVPNSGALPASEVGPRDGVDRGEAGPTADGAGRTADSGGTSGTQGG